MENGGFYIFPIDCIAGPVLVVPDILDEHDISTECFLAILPRHKWGGFFKYHVDDFITTKEGDDVQVDIEEEYTDDW